MAYASTFRPGGDPRRTATAGSQGGDTGGETTTRSLPTAGSSQGETTAANERPARSSRQQWKNAGLIGTGLLLGALVGAAVALLTTPMSGPEMRAGIVRRSRRVRDRTADAWDDLADELRWAAQVRRKQARRSVRKAGWAADDAVSHLGRRVRKAVRR